MDLKRSTFKLILSTLLLLCVCPMAFAEKAFNVLIVANSKDEPYQLAISGFKEQLIKSQNIRYTEIVVAQNKDLDSSLLLQIKDKKPDLIFSLGGESTALVIRNTSTIPIVATMILKKFSAKIGANVTGVYLNYPLNTQFTWLKKFFPKQNKVAIFFNPEENEAVIQEAREIAGQEGLNLIAIPVQTPKELPYALDQLRNNIEILLAIPDDVVMSSKTAKEVLLASFRNRVPLVGLSENWVKSGALYSLTWDYDDLGRQCALQTEKLIKGTAVMSVPIESPRKIAYSINTKIAEHMNMEISAALLQNAKLIFN
ncbi:MAG: ABC transporter substrate-binding protein [Methylococcaceae bacterium]|nr:ABC transporter substrate-binding protein [Methylococcaceae bacterium]